MLSKHNFIARALIDTGATNSFVLYKFARNLLAKPNPLEQALIVKILSKSILEDHVVTWEGMGKIKSTSITHSVLRNTKTLISYINPFL